MALANLLPLEQGSAGLLSAVTVSGVKYDIRDYAARNALSSSLSVIDQLSAITKGGVHYEGKLTETQSGSGIPDVFSGYPDSVSATGEGYINGKRVYWNCGEDSNVSAGDIVLISGTKGNIEYIWDGKFWQRFGSMDGLGQWAWYNTAGGECTPNGEVGISADGALTVQFSSGGFSGNEVSVAASFTGAEVTATGDFAGSSATISADVTNVDDTLTVQFSNAVVNVITGFTHNAISKPADLTVSTNADDITININGQTIDNVLKSASSGTITSVLTAWTGSNTIFNGKYKPEGIIQLSGVGISGGIDHSDPSISADIGSLGISGLTSTHNLKSSGTVTVTTDNCKPIMSCNTPSISASSGTNNFLSTATVTNEVLSFGSGAALTQYSSKLSNDISSVITSWSGNPTFNGGTPTGSITTVGKLSGSPDVGIQSAGHASLTGMGLTGTAVFDGTEKDVSTSGTPSGSPKSVALNYIQSVTSGKVDISGSGSIASGTLVTGVAYASGDSGTKATFTYQSGNVNATGTQMLTYSKAKSVSTSYTPSGNISIDPFTPSGTVSTTKFTPSGTLTGTQTIAAHTHGAAFSGKRTTVDICGSV